MQYIKKNKRIITCDLKEIEEVIEWKDGITSDGIDIYKDIQKLDNKYKTIIILRFYEDLKIEEIAKITKLNISTVKARLYKGLEILKKFIENNE